MNTNSKLDQISLDKLNRISIKGAEQASQALSIMTNQSLEISFSKVKTINVTDLGNLAEDLDLVTAVLLKIQGDLTGSILLLIDEQSAFNLVDLLLANPAMTTNNLGDFEVSALKETGNILAGNYIATLANELGVSVMESVPDFAYDSYPTLLNSIALELLASGEQTFVFETNFEIKNQSAKGKMLVFMDSDSSNKVSKLLA